MKKAKLILFVLALLSCFCLILTSCTEEEIPPVVKSERTISGEVKSDLGAVVGAEVSVRSTDYKVTTDANGKFEIKLSADDSWADTYTLVVKKDGFLDQNLTVKASDFTNDSASVQVTLLSQKIAISGVIKDGDTPVSGVTVGASCDSETATTDENGQYSLVIDRPVDSFRITFTKEFYKTAEESVSNFAVTNYTLNVTLDKQVGNISGVVSHYFYGNLSGVSVVLKGTEYSTTTDADGKFSIQNIENVALPYTLVISKDGYQTKEVTVDGYGEDSLEIELVSEEISLGNLSPSNKNYSMYIVRDSAGIHFRFVSDWQFAETDKICVYIDVNETGVTSVGSTVAELGLCGNGVCVLWNLKKNESASDSATIFWDNEVKFKLNNGENGSEIEAFISYDTFAKLGDEFAITKDSVIGFSFFDRGAGVGGAAGWDRADIPGADGAAWVHPDNPKDFVRLAPENIIYGADNNTYVPYGDYTVEITVKDNNTVLEGANVKMTYPVEQIVITDENGVARFVLSGVNFNKVPIFEITSAGYSIKAVTVERDQFTDGKASINVAMELLPSYIEETGTVKNYNGALEGVTVKVKGYEEKGSVTTDAQGKYDLSSLKIELDDTTYVLILSKDGYDTKEVMVTVGSDVGTIYMKAEARNLGAFGEYGWNITIDRDDTKLIIDAKSALNWYGYQDKSGNASGENNFQIWFATNLQAKSKTADEIREVRIVEKESTGAANWAGWLDGSGNFLAWPGIAFSVVNDADGCSIHVEVLYSVLGIDKTTTIGLGFGEWYAADTETPWACPFYDGATQTFIESGWAVNCNDPSSLLHWAPDNSTKVEYVAG